MDNRRVIVRTSASADTFWTRERGEHEVTRDGRVLDSSGAATPFALPRLPPPPRCVSPLFLDRDPGVEGKVLGDGLRDRGGNALDMIAQNKKLVDENSLLRRRLRAAQQMIHVLVDLAVHNAPS